MGLSGTLRLERRHVPGTRRLGWAGLGLVIALGGAVPATAAEGGAVPGRVTVERSTACLLVGGAFDFESQRLAVPSDPPVAHRSTTTATITSCANQVQDVFVHGTNAVGDADPPAGWQLSSTAPSAACQSDTYGLTTSFGGPSRVPVGLLDAPFTSVMPDLGFEAAADLFMPCLGSGGGGETMTFSVVYTAVLGGGTPEPSPSATPIPTPGPERLLTILAGGTGTGLVTSDPPGLACHPPCSAGFANGSLVTLQAAPSNGSIFVGWSGGACAGTTTCVVYMHEETTITATFSDLPMYVLSVSIAGTGQGVVVSVPGGINCGPICSSSFTANAFVSLQAFAATGSRFVSWSGACSGAAACGFNMTGNRAVAALFEPDQP